MADITHLYVSAGLLQLIDQSLDFVAERPQRGHALAQLVLEDRRK